MKIDTNMQQKSEQELNEFLETVVSEIAYEDFREYMEEYEKTAILNSPLENIYAALYYFGATMSDFIYGNCTNDDKYVFEYEGDTIFCATDSEAYDFAGDEMTADDEDNMLEIYYGDIFGDNIYQLRKEIGDSADYVNREKYLELLHYNNTGSNDLSDLWLDCTFGEVCETIQLDRAYYEIRKF